MSLDCLNSILTVYGKCKQLQLSASYWKNNVNFLGKSYLKLAVKLIISFIECRRHKLNT